VVAEMMRLARPGGWVASQEPDVEHALCFPAVPAWDRLIELFRASHRQLGADPCIGRRTAGLFRDAGLVDIEVTAYSPVFSRGPLTQGGPSRPAPRRGPGDPGSGPGRPSGTRRARSRGPCASRRPARHRDPAPPVRGRGTQATANPVRTGGRR
jgi:hypothetical protein